MKKKGILVSIFLMIFMVNAHAFEEGFIWGFKANAFGGVTLPSINNDDLGLMGAEFMKGGMGLYYDGEVDLGYIFGTEKWFPKIHGKTFSGVSVYASLGIGTGGVREIAGKTVSGKLISMFVNVDYAPVLSFGVGSKAYFFENRLSAGLWLGTKIIADMSPSYLAYSDDPSAVSSEIGEIIVTNNMIKNMNPFSFSIRGCLEYHQPINHWVRMTLGVFGRFNIYSPKYITMPKSLMDMMNADLQKSGKPRFDAENTPLKSFFLNSLDFGVTVGFTFRGSVYKAPKNVNNI